MIVFLLMLGCTSEPLSPLSFERELVWSDEFDGPINSGLDPEKWVAEIGRGASGWGNNELQYYTERPENIRHNGSGQLEITALRESYEDADYTSARIKTQGLFSVQYGRIEASIKLPEGQGLWPAFWMLGDSYSEIGWPACGEIDIMEFRGGEPNRVLSTVHGPDYSGGESIGDSMVDFDNPFTDDFHVYSVDHAPDYLAFFVDDEMIFQIQKGSLQNDKDWVYNAPFFLLLNMAVGGNFVGSPLVSSFPATMLVDYVRVYSHVD